MATTTPSSPAARRLQYVILGGGIAGCTAAEELLALRRRLMRLKKCEELAPNGIQRVGYTEAEILDAKCAYHCVKDLVSPVGTLSVPVQC